MSSMHFINTLKNIGKTLFPSFCINCGKETGEEMWLCASCYNLLLPLPHTICPSCAARTIDGRLEHSCVQKTGLTKFFCAYPLQQKPLQALVYIYKYRHNGTLHTYCSRLLLQWLGENHLNEIFEKTSNLVFVPIPLHKERLRERGFNQAEFLARDIAKKFGRQCSPSSLVRIKPTPSQLVAHTKEAREKNMEDAFAVKNPDAVIGKRVVLVDDVYTTGATMKHAALALRKAGAAEVWGIAIAKG